MENDSLFEKIEGYLKDKLPEAEKKAFEAEIQSNGQLATQVELQRFELDAIELLIEEDLRKDMVAWKDGPATDTSKGKTEPASNGRSANPLRWMFPLVILGGIAFALYFFSPFNPGDPDEPVAAEQRPDNQELPAVEAPQETPPDPDPTDPDRPVAENTETAPEEEEIPTPEPAPEKAKEQLETAPKINNAPVVASSSNYLELATQAFKDSYLQSVPSDASEQLKVVNAAYTKGKYEATVEIVQTTFAGSEIEYVNALEYSSAAHFRLKQFEQVEQINTTILQLGTAKYRERAEYNLLLALVAQEKTMSVDFAKLLNKITSDTDHFGHASAKKLKSEGRL